MKLVIDPNAPRNHRLKCWPHFYGQLCGGIKSFEIRKDDRGFRVGDSLSLEEYDPETDQYSGRGYNGTITYILRGEEAEQFGVQPGYCVLSLWKRFEYYGAGTRENMSKSSQKIDTSEQPVESIDTNEGAN